MPSPFQLPALAYLCIPWLKPVETAMANDVEPKLPTFKTNRRRFAQQLSSCYTTNCTVYPIAARALQLLTVCQHAMPIAHQYNDKI